MTMPTFDSPGPIAVAISLAMGDVRITAADRADTVVEVRPSDDHAKSVKAAEQTTVEFAHGRLTVKTPKSLSSYLGRPGGVDVDIQLPSGSSLEGDTGMGDLTTDGRLGAVRFRSGMGELRISDTDSLSVSTGAGNVSAVSVNGDADITTGIGELRVGAIAGTAVLKSSSGVIRVGQVTKPAQLVTSYGDIFIDSVLGGALAKTALGSIRVREARQGKIEMLTSLGTIEAGIPEGTSAWLDLDTPATIQNTLTAAGGPGDAAEQVRIRARTKWGDIVIRRSEGKYGSD
jgi:hypothetical protein